MLLFPVSAHSTRALSALWVFHHNASVAQVFKAATWSFVHTFRVNVAASADASF